MEEIIFEDLEEVDFLMIRKVLEEHKITFLDTATYTQLTSTHKKIIEIINQLNE